MLVGWGGQAGGLSTADKSCIVGCATVCISRSNLQRGSTQLPLFRARRYMAIKGLHVPQNFTKAREHFQDAAAYDLPSALNGLGARAGTGRF